jgi:hypothetical protein
LPSAPPPSLRLKSAICWTGRPALRATTSMSVVFLQRGVGELILQAVEQPLRLGAPVLGLEIGLALLEGLGGRRLNADELQDVIAELGLDRPLISPTFMLKAASANGPTKTLRSDQPRSPPCCAEPGSCENSFASFREILARLARFKNPRPWLDARIVLRIATGNQNVAHAALLGCVKRSGVLAFCSS